MNITPLGNKQNNTIINFKSAHLAEKSDKNVIYHKHGLTNTVINYANIPKSVLKEFIVQQRTSELKPIESESEYSAVLDKIFGYMIKNKYFEANLIMKTGYESSPHELDGLIAYCGPGDLSNAINSWVTARQFDFQDELDNDKMINIIRALEYSLKKLDEKVGTYQGRVYRVGHFNPFTDKQFYSASKSIGCAYKHSQENSPSPFYPYSIIKLKNGHHIQKFQEIVNSSASNHFAKIEKEILIDRNSKFKKIPQSEYTKQDIKDILSILNKSLKLKLAPEDLERLNRNIDILKYISVWEEV